MRKIATIVMSLALFTVLTVTASAQVTADVSRGDVVIGSTHVNHVDRFGDSIRTPHNGNVLVIQSDAEKAGGVCVKASGVVNVTLDGLDQGLVMLKDTDIAVEKGPAIHVADNTHVIFELEGTNNLLGGEDRAGLEVAPTAQIVILDTNLDGGALNATGGSYGAGIGGGSGLDSGKITISGGVITATAGWRSAGIGGGRHGSGNDITITGGTVIALGDSHGAGIGGGEKGSASNITILGGNVDATGGKSAAGIGGGDRGSAVNVHILGGNVNAQGASSGAGIGGGQKGNADNITVTGGVVNALAGSMGAGIGGGWNGIGSNISISGDAVVTALGSNFGANIGDGAGDNATQRPDKGDLTQLNYFGSFNSIPGNAQVKDSIPLAPTPETEAP